MITVQKSKIPMWLKNSHFYQNVNNSFEILPEQYKTDTDIDSIDDLKKLITTAVYWSANFDNYIFSVYNFVDQSESNYFILIGYLYENISLDVKYMSKIIKFVRDHVEMNNFKFEIIINKTPRYSDVKLNIKIGKVNMFPEFFKIPIIEFRKEMFQGLKLISQCLKNKKLGSKYLTYINMSKDSSISTEAKREFAETNKIDMNNINFDSINVPFINLPYDIILDYIDMNSEISEGHGYLELDMCRLIYNPGEDILTLSFKILGFNNVIINVKNERDKLIIADELKKIYESFEK